MSNTSVLQALLAGQIQVMRDRITQKRHVLDVRVNCGTIPSDNCQNHGGQDVKQEVMDITEGSGDVDIPRLCVHSNTDIENDNLIATPVCNCQTPGKIHFNRKFTESVTLE